MKAALARNKVLAGGVTAILAMFLVSFALAGSGTKTISAVQDNGDQSYYLTLNSTTGITVGDHFGAKLSGGAGALYTVSEVGTAVRVNDNLHTANGGEYGAPATGSAWYSTPSTTVTLAVPPHSGVGWNAPLAHNIASVESQLGPLYLTGIGDITTAAVGDVFVYGAGDKWTLLVPGTSGDVLTSNGAGSLPSYQTPASGGSSALLDGSTHTDTVAQTVTRGSIIYGNSTPAWDELTLGAANTLLGSDGTDASWRTLTATIDGAIGSTQGSFLYRGASNWTAIAPQTSGKILVTQGSSANPNYYTLSQLMGGAIGNTQGDILYHNGTDWVVLSAGTSGDVLTTQGAGSNPTWSTPGGGSTHAMLSATHTDSTAAAVSRGSVIIGVGATPKWEEVTVGAANTVLGSDGTDTTFRTISATLEGLSSTQGHVAYRDGTSWTTIAPSISGLVLTTQGAGQNVRYNYLTNLMDSEFGSTRGSVLIRGASGWTILAPGTSGNVLTSNGAGADPSYQASGGSATWTAIDDTDGDASFRSDHQLRWTNSASASGTNDVGLERNAAGTLGVTDGSTGTGDVIAGIYSGTTVNVTTVIGTNYQTREATAGVHHYIHLQHNETSGTGGGSSSAATWETRTIDEEKTDTGNLCTLSSNQFQLAAGTYEIEAWATFHRTNLSKIRLRNVTANSTVLVGASQFANDTNGDCISRVTGRFNIASGAYFEIQSYTASAFATSGWGAATSSGEEEVYLDVILRRVGD